VADLESRASIAARDEAISPLIAARDVLKNLLGLSPTDTEAVQQVRTIEGRLRALFLERASGQREHEAMATYRELLQHLPGDTEATAKLSRLEEKKSARSRRRMAITAGVAVVVIAFLGLLRYVAQVQTDERGWTTAATAADAAGVNYEQAIQQYRQYLDQFPQGRHASQAREFVEVILPQQIDDQAWKLACTGAEAAGAKYDAAIQQYTQYLSHFPQGRYASKAKELVEVALPQQIDDQAWKATTTAAEEAGPNYELAIQQYRQYIDRFPQGRHVTTAKQLVEVALPQQILDRKYRTAVKDASNYLRLKDWVNADQAIRRALEMKPDGAESAQLREEQLKMVDDLREQQYQEGLSHAQASMAGGEPEAAVEFCRAALAAKPNDPTALQVLRDATESSKRAKVYGDAMSQARSLLDQQNWTEALAAVNTALSTVPQDKAALAFKDKIKESEINAHYQEAIIEAKSHLSQQEWDAASSSCNRALTYKPDDQDAKTLLAVITKAAHDAINSIPDLDPAEVIKQVWGKGAGTTDQLERRFAKKYAGQKVKYQGTVDDILENEGSVIFKGGGTWPQNYKIKATLGPTNRSKLQTLSKGQSLLVIGELKGLKAAAFGIGANVILISVPD
jgi:tetratricopeptide (TPR) repeat protein